MKTVNDLSILLNGELTYETKVSYLIEVLLPYAKELAGIPVPYESLQFKGSHTKGYHFLIDGHLCAILHMSTGYVELGHIQFQLNTRDYIEVANCINSIVKVGDANRELANSMRVLNTITDLFK